MQLRLGHVNLIEDQDGPLGAGRQFQFLGQGLEALQGRPDPLQRSGPLRHDVHHLGVHPVNVDPSAGGVDIYSRVFYPAVRQPPEELVRLRDDLPLLPLDPGVDVHLHNLPVGRVLPQPPLPGP